MFALATIAAILAVPAMWLIARNAVNMLHDRDRPAEAMYFWPDSGAAEASLALDRVVAANGAVDPQSRALFESALRRAPLLGDPLILAGLEASAANDVDRARRLMEEARRRDPRAIIARSWLFDYYLGAGDYAAGIDEAGPLMALQGGAAPAILTVLTSLLSIPQARPALLAKLRASPRWRTAFFIQSSESPALVPAMASLLRDAPNPYPPAALLEQQALLAGLAAEGRYGLAHNMWLAQLPPAYRLKARAQPIYDGDFHGWPGTAPFAWQIRNHGDGSTARADVRDLPEGSALEIASDAYQSEPAADQVLLAPPGPYRLVFKLRRTPDTDPSAAQLGVAMRCADAASAARSPLAYGAFIPPAAQAVGSIDLTVPRDCPAQLLRLFVLPGDDPGTLDAQVTAVRLLPR